MPEETYSAESEAGPSSASPTPETPQPVEPSLPAPLRSDPIVVHSPYDEPEIYAFPVSDPDFEFVLAIENGDDSTFTPTPFSKTLVGLAELGILSPELPDYAWSARSRDFKSSFQPFDLHIPADNTPIAGPSRPQPQQQPQYQPQQQQREEQMMSSADQEEEDQPRIGSRFDFARPASHTPNPHTLPHSRGESPFALRRVDVSEQPGDWGVPPSMTHAQQHHQQRLEEQISAQRQQRQQLHGERGGAPAFRAPGTADWVPSLQDWAQTLGQGQGQGQSQGRMSPNVRTDQGMGRPRDDYEPGKSYSTG